MYGMVPPLKSVQDYVKWTSSDPKGRKTVFHPFGQLLLLLPAVFTYEKRVSYGTRKQIIIIETANTYSKGFATSHSFASNPPEPDLAPLAKEGFEPSCFVFGCMVVW